MKILEHQEQLLSIIEEQEKEIESLKRQNEMLLRLQID